MARRVPTDLTMLARLYAIWEPQEDARRQISEDLKELFAEAKSNGYNPKALRKAFAERYRIDHQTDEQALKANQTDEDTELYLSALARVRESDADDEPADPASAGAAADGGSENAPATVDTLHPQPASLAGLPGATAPGERIKEPAHSDLSEVGAVGEGGRAALAVAAEPGGEGGQANAFPAARVMSMTPLEPRTAGGLKGFGFTVSFDERPVVAGGVQVPHRGEVA